MDGIHRHNGLVEYMVLQRMAALAEVQWTQPEKKDYADFTRRLPRLMELYQRDGMNYAKHIFDIQAEFTTTQEETEEGNGAVVATLHTIDNAPVYYTLDGTEPTTASQRYNGTGIAIRQSARPACRRHPSRREKQGDSKKHRFQ